MSYKKLSIITTFILLSFILIRIWGPLFQKYYVQHENIDNATINRLRQTPDDLTLNKLSSLGVGVAKLQPYLDSRPIENVIEEGVRTTYSNNEINLRKLDERQLFSGDSDWQLSASSFVVVKLHLNAFKKTGEIHFLRMAESYINTFIDINKKTFFDKGFLKNDHAVAARIYVLVDFWRLYRNSQVYDPEFTQKFFSFILNNARQLENNSNYTFRTNHGAMQNLSLAVLGAAFKELPNSELFIRKGLERFQEQLTFLLSNDSVFLEHSPGYHLFLTEILASFEELSKDLDLQQKTEFADTLSRSLKALQAFTRPDYRITSFGDTGNDKKLTGSKLIRYINPIESPRNTLFEDTGYAYFTVPSTTHCKDHYNKTLRVEIDWQNVPYLGHRHQDDTALNLQVCGLSVLQQVGYYPYALQGRKEAILHQGSNAPYYSDETKQNNESTRLIYSLFDEHNNIILLAFHRPNETRKDLFRYLISLPNAGIIILDRFAGKTGTSGRVNWIFNQNIKVIRLDQINIKLKTPNDITLYMSSPAIQNKRYSITKTKVESKKKLVDTTVVVFNQPAQIIDMPTLFTFEPVVSLNVISNNDNSNRWQLIWKSESGRSYDLEFKDNLLRINNYEHQVNIHDTRRIDTIQKQRRANFYEVSNKYKTIKPLISYRIKITWICVALFFISLIVILFYNAWLIFALSSLGWSFILAWIHFVYLSY